MQFNNRKPKTYTNDFQDMVKIGLNFMVKKTAANLWWVSADVELSVHRRHHQVQQIVREVASQDVPLQVVEATGKASEQQT